jgi:hypothetical protein
MSQQQQKEQQQGTISSSKWPDPEGKIWSPNVTYKDHVREARLPSFSLGTADGTGGGAVATTVADNIPIISTVAVSDTRIAAEEHEERLQEAERRAAVAESARQSAEAERQAAEAERQDHEVRLVRLEQQTANGHSSPKQLSQRQRNCIVVVVVIVLIAAGAVAGICGTGFCSSPTPVPAPVVSTTPTNTATTRADTILPYINSITLLGRTLKYPSRSSSAEEWAVQWLVEDDVNTAVDDKPSLRQRYVLATLWFFHLSATSTGFGFADHAATWTTSRGECEWFDVKCDGNGRVTAVYLGSKGIRGQIPADLGLLTDLTFLALWGNLLSGTIPSSLGALTALTSLSLWENQLNGTIPSSLGALSALTYLSLWGNKLSGNQLSGTLPSSLGALTALTSLDLRHNQLSGTIPSSLGALTALTILWLNDNQLSGTIPSSLGALAALTYLSLRGNQLSGTIPSSLGALTALTSLWLHNNQLVGMLQLGPIICILGGRLFKSQLHLLHRMLPCGVWQNPGLFIMY